MKLIVPLTEVEIAEACRDWVLKPERLPPGKYKAGSVKFSFTPPDPPFGAQSFDAKVDIESVD